MKTFTAILLLTVFITLQSVAGPRVIFTGRNQLCMYVVQRPDAIECLGHGSTICPSRWDTISYRGAKASGTDIISYVTQHIESGELTGTGEINTITFKWEGNDDGYQIWIDSEKLIYPEDGK
jgi:hypothetical protein